MSEQGREKLVVLMKRYSPDEVRATRASQQRMLVDDEYCQRIADISNVVGVPATIETVRKSASRNLALLAIFRPEVL